MVNLVDVYYDVRSAAIDLRRRTRWLNRQAVSAQYLFDRAASFDPHVRRLLLFVSLFSGCWVMAVAGTLYGYSLYAVDLKDEMRWSTTESNVLGSLGDWGLYFGIIPGLAVDFFGPQITLLAAALLHFVGYFGIFWLANGLFHLRSSFLAGFCFFMVGQGGICAYIASLVSNERNFPIEHRGKAVGLLVSFFGLSASFATFLYDIFFENQPVALFLLFLSLVVSGVIILNSPWIRAYADVPETMEQRLEETERRRRRRRERMKRRLRMQRASVDPNAPLFSDVPEPAPIDDVDETINTEAYRLMDSIKMETEGDEERSEVVQEKVHEIVQESFVVVPRATFHEEHEEEEAEDGGKRDPPKDFEESISGWRLFINPASPLLFGIVLLSTGPGLLIVNNVGFVVKSMKIEEGSSNFVLLISICNCLGRLAVGLISDPIVRKGNSRVLLLFVVAYSTLLGNLMLLLYTSYSVMFVAVTIIALGYGAVWGTWPVVIRESFGSRHFGVNFGFFAMAPGFAVTIFSLMSSYLFVFVLYLLLPNDRSRYQQAGSSQKNVPHNECYGQACFRWMWVINMCTCVVNMFLCVAFIFYERHRRERWNMKFQSLNRIDRRDVERSPAEERVMLLSPEQMLVIGEDEDDSY